MTDFDFTGIPIVPPPPPIDPMVAREEKIANDTRVESELNRFIVAKQEALFAAPDAYYRKQGVDAVDGAPQAIQRLHEIKDALLDGLANDYQRRRLTDALDTHMILARDGIGRHAAEQSLVWQRQTATNRIDLLTKEASLHHTADDERIDALGEAAATAARARERVGDAPVSFDVENRAAAAARSRVLSATVQARLDAGNRIDAAKLYDRVKADLNDRQAEALDEQLKDAQSGNEEKAVGFQVIPGPMTSHEEADGWHFDAPAESQGDHADDPEQKAAVPETPGASDGREEEEVERDRVEPAWPSTPEADGNAQGDLPSPAVASTNAEVPPRRLAAAMVAPALRTAAPDMAIGGELAGAASRLAPLVKGGGLLTAAGILLLPRNFQGGTIDLGDDLRARWAPGQRSATIERRVDNGLFGTGFGAKWEELPVDATYEPDEHGRQTLRVDAAALKQALAAAPKTQMSGRSIHAPFETLPASKPTIYEIRIAASADGGQTASFREATHEELEQLCPNYPMILGVGLRASLEVGATGVPHGPRRGQMIHKLAEDELKIVRSAEILREIGIVEMSPEVALLYGERLSYSWRKGSSRLDVVEIYARGGEKTACVYDFKTGKAVFPDATAMRYAHEVGRYVKEEYHQMPIRIIVAPVYLH